MHASTADPAVQRFLAVHFAGLRGKGLRHQPRFVTGPRRIDAEVAHAILNVMDVDPSVLLHPFERVSRHLEPRQLCIRMRTGDAANREEALFHIVVSQHGDVGRLCQFLQRPSPEPTHMPSGSPEHYPGTPGSCRRSVADRGQGSNDPPRASPAAQEGTVPMPPSSRRRRSPDHRRRSWVRQMSCAA